MGKRIRYVIDKEKKSLSPLIFLFVEIIIYKK